MRARVLVVHDVAAMRTVLSQALESEGCTAIGVEDCGRASELAKLDPPDVIVADERVIDEAPRPSRRCGTGSRRWSSWRWLPRCATGGP